MAFIDALLLLCDAQAFTIDAVSTNTVDLGAASRDIATGEPLDVVLQVDVAADATAGTETYQFNFIQSASADLSSPDVLISRIISRTLLTIGTIHRLPIAAGSVTKRYVGLSFTGGGTTPTITLTAWIEPRSMASIAKPQIYPKGYVG